MSLNFNNVSRTKMVCTLGPATSSPEMIAQLIDSGMNVARLNFSHGNHEGHAQNIEWLRKIAAEKKQQVAILQDLQGPKIRTGKLIGNAIQLTAGQKVTLRYGAEQTDPNIIPIDYKELVMDVRVGAKILMDDGLLGMEIIEMDGADVICTVTHGGILKSRKGVNFPHCKLSIPAMTEKDIRDLLFGVSQNVDYIALSFVQSAQDVLNLKMMIRALGAETPVVSKIEMFSAIEDIDNICEASDAIMVARGDLGVECGFANVAYYQKQIVQAALKKGKPVIVATQMLDSMIEHRRPSKAEVCDVANAVFDRADATMLSGESASGKYPILAVKTMRDILNRVDKSGKVQPIDMEQKSGAAISEVLARTAVEIADKAKATAIVSLTLTGYMALLMAKHRPNTPIIAFSPRVDVVRRLALVRGVQGVHNNIFYDTDDAFEHIIRFLVEGNYVKKGDLVLITGGIPVSQMKPTNCLKIHCVQ